MIETSVEKNPAEFIEDVINSYETQIKNIEALFSTSEAVNDSSHRLFDNLNRSIIELSEERLQLNSKLRDSLAKNGSLRKNDYDTLMDEIFQVLKNLENEAKSSFIGYLEDQKAMVKLVRKNILALKNKEKQTQKELIREFKKELEQIMLAQQRGKELVITNFIRFQNMHNKLTLHFKQLIGKQKNVNSKDVKELKNILLSEIKLLFY
jgi:hypothetical protein